MEQKKSQLKIGIILNYINIGMGNLIPIFYMPVMLKLLGQSEYGLYKLSGSITGYLSLISFGIGSAVTRYLIKAYTEAGKEAEERILGLFMMIFQVIAVISFGVGLLLVWKLDIWYASALTESELERMRVIVFLMVCNTSLSFSVSPYISIVNAHEKFIFLQITNIVTTCVGPLANLVVLYMGYASVGMTVSSLAIGVLVRYLYLYYVKKVMRIRAKYKNMPMYLMKEILTFSFWVFVSNVVGQLYNATDTVMIGAIPALATTGVAVYNVGATFNSIVFSMTTGISSLLAPATNKLVFSGADNKRLTDMAIRIGRLQGYIISLIVSGFIAFGRPFIFFYAGEEYRASFWVAVLMMIPNVVPLVQSICLNIIVAQNKHKFRSIVYLIIAILNVIGTWFLMKIWGIVGAALMTAIAMFIGHGFLMNWYYCKKIGLEIRRFWKEVGNVLWLPFLICFGTLLLTRWIDFYRLSYLVTGILIFIVIDVALNWMFIMNEYEKGLVKELLLPLKRKKR